MPLYCPSSSQCLVAWCSFAVTRRTHTIGIQRNAVQIMIACQQTASWRAIVEDVSLPLGSSESRSHAASGFDRLRITRFTYVFASSLTPLRVYLQFPCACFCHLRAEGLRAGYIFQFIRVSGPVQVFGRRNAETFPALGQPASEKRQGTKSRGVGHRLCGERYGDLARA
jgi:hypothetical protein